MTIRGFGADQTRANVGMSDDLCQLGIWPLGNLSTNLENKLNIRNLEYSTLTQITSTFCQHHSAIAYCLLEVRSIPRKENVQEKVLSICSVGVRAVTRV